MAYNTYSPPTEEKISFLNATTDKWYASSIEQFVYEGSVLLKRLMSKHKVKIKGGRQLQWPVRIAKLGTAAAVDPRDPVTWSTNDTIIGATLNWKYYFGKTLIQWDELAMNQGEAELVDLSGEKATELIEDMHDVLIQALFRTTTADAKDMASLDDMIGTTTYAGIDPTTLDDPTRWQSTVEDQASLALELFVDATYTSLAKAINSATFGNKKPSLIITHEDIYDQMDSYITKTFGQIKVNQEMAKLGFPNIEFRSIPIVQDPHCPEGYIFGIDEDAIELVVHPDYNLKQTPWKNHENYPNALFKGVSWMGNLKTKRRHTHFKFTDVASVTAS